MNRCVLIQANGNGERMKDYFGIPKHHLYYKGDKIINNIISNIQNTGIDYYIATKYKQDGLGKNIILCMDTNNRLQTLQYCLEYLQNYDSIIVHDCDVIFDSKCISNMYGDMISISAYKQDGYKYGFISIDNNLQYKNGNEKIKEEPFITTGIYSFNRKNMQEFIAKNQESETLLDYYNTHNPKLYYTEEFTNLGDINSYMNNI